MKILALDSSSSVASVAVVTADGDDMALVFEENIPQSRSDSSALFRAFEMATSSAGTPDTLCVGIGPGSYNGLRASVSAARAMATALEIPLHAIPSPLGLPGPAAGYWALGDARGGHLWLACVKEGAFLQDPILIPPSEFSLHLRKHPDFPVLGSALLEEIPSLRIATPSAFLLARLAHRCKPVYFSGTTPQPIYLKPPHITAPKSANATK